MTDRFRSGRAFLLGDAAHVHSPAGGQGMNTGIGDAINLAWKLAMVLQGHAPAALLYSYEAERLGFARSLVKTTDRVFSLATSDGAVARIARTRLVPRLLPRLLASKRLRELAFRVVSQTRISYRNGPLANGRAGHLRGGDRLPWVAADGTDNYVSLATIAWHVHVYGDAEPTLRAWCDERGVPLSVFGWHERHGRAGIPQGATVLLRPDTYIAVIAERDGVAAFSRFFEARGINLAQS